MSKAITIIGIPSAFLLHGYVGFIFGSIKANLVGQCADAGHFHFSAIVSGIALCVLVYGVWKSAAPRMLDDNCLDAMGKFLFYALVVDLPSKPWIGSTGVRRRGIDFGAQATGVREIILHAAGRPALSRDPAPLLMLGSAQLFRTRIAMWVRRRLASSARFDRDRRAGDALERRDRRATVFEESLRGFTSFKLELAGRKAGSCPSPS